MLGEQLRDLVVVGLGLVVGERGHGDRRDLDDLPLVHLLVVVPHLLGSGRERRTGDPHRLLRHQLGLQRLEDADLTRSRLVARGDKPPGAQLAVERLVEKFLHLAIVDLDAQPLPFLPKQPGEQQVVPIGAPEIELGRFRHPGFHRGELHEVVRQHARVGQLFKIGPVEIPGAGLDQGWVTAPPPLQRSHQPHQRIAEDKCDHRRQKGEHQKPFLVLAEERER